MNLKEKEWQRIYEIFLGLNNGAGRFIAMSFYNFKYGAYFGNAFNIPFREIPLKINKAQTLSEEAIYLWRLENGHET